MPMPMTDQFAFGAINPIISFLMALLGAVFGLSCTARAQRVLDGKKRMRWLLLAGVALGGIGIWLMHFMAMLGFDVPTSPIRYDVPLTALSLVIAVGVVTGGLLFVGLGRPAVWKLIAGGVVTGVGVAGMHYTGMAAVNLNGAITYQPRVLAASVLVAVVASTVALWFTVAAKKGFMIAVASVIFALAVCSMHYTGMAAVRVNLSHQALTTPPGVSSIDLVVPIALIAIIGTVALLFAAMAMMSTEPGARRDEAPAGPVTVPPGGTRDAVAGFGLRGTTPGFGPQDMSGGYGAQEPAPGYYRPQDRDGDGRHATRTDW